MNDEFENRLRADAAKCQRRDPTGGWKAGILARADVEREPEPEPGVHTPRWWFAGLAAAWVFIFILRATTPGTGPMTHTAAAPVAASFAPATSPDAPMRGLIALNKLNSLQ